MGERVTPGGTVLAYHAKVLMEWSTQVMIYSFILLSGLLQAEATEECTEREQHLTGEHITASASAAIDRLDNLEYSNHTSVHSLLGTEVTTQRGDWQLLN